MDGSFSNTIFNHNKKSFEMWHLKIEKELVNDVTAIREDFMFWYFPFFA